MFLKLKEVISMKKYTKPSMEIVNLKVEENITAPTTFYKRGAATISLLGKSGTTITAGEGTETLS